MEQAIDNLPDRTATKVVEKVSTVVKEEADGVKEYIDKKFDEKFNALDERLAQYLGQPPREGETYAESKQRLKTERVHQDEALNNLEAMRRSVQAAEDNKQTAEDREKQRQRLISKGRRIGRNTGRGQGESGGRGGQCGGRGGQ